MSTKNERLQGLIRYYKRETGKTEINMRDVAVFADAKGWQMPNPKSPLDLFARDLSDAAREELRHDEKTGRPYRANHAYKQQMGSGQLTLWIDIDEAPRMPMLKALKLRRNQMIGDGLQLTLDANHWNSIHESEEPLVMPLDFTEDVEERLNAPDEDQEAA